MQEDTPRNFHLHRNWELHTCDCTAGPTLLCHETGNGAYSKQMRQQTSYLTHRTFFVEEILLSCQSGTQLSQYTIRKQLRAWGSNMWTGRMYQNPCFAATQQASITSTLHRFLFSLIVKCNSLAGSCLREATTVNRRL